MAFQITVLLFALLSKSMLVSSGSSSPSIFSMAAQGLFEIIDFAKYMYNFDFKAASEGPFQQPPPSPSSACAIDQNGNVEQDHFDYGMQLLGQQQWEMALTVFQSLWAFSTEIERLQLRHCIEIEHPVDILFMAQQAAVQLKQYDVAEETGYQIFNYPSLPVDLARKAEKALQEIEGAKTDQTMREALADFASQDPKREEDGANKISTLSSYRLCTDELADSRAKEIATSPYAFCRLNDRNRHPLLILSPVKEEIMSLEPIAVVFHDMLFKSDMEKLKALGVERLKVATLFGRENETLEHTRKSDIGWIPSTNFPELNVRIEAAVGMDPREGSSESYQLAHYTTAGHYLPHYDSFGPNEQSQSAMGDRIATLMFYMSEVESGGRTCFNKLGLAVTPETGSGVFWYNTFPNETSDDRLLHAACPVLRGEKWAANKWFRFRGQFLHRPCPRDPFGEFSLDDFDMPKRLREAMARHAVRKKFEDFKSLPVTYNLLDKDIREIEPGTPVDDEIIDES